MLVEDSQVEGAFVSRVAEVWEGSGVSKITTDLSWGDVRSHKSGTQWHFCDPNARQHRQVDLRNSLAKRSSPKRELQVKWGALSQKSAHGTLRWLSG